MLAAILLGPNILMNVNFPDNYDEYCLLEKYDIVHSTVTSTTRKIFSRLYYQQNIVTQLGMILLNPRSLAFTKGLLKILVVTFWRIKK